MMLTHTTTWSHPPGNAVVPSRWQATSGGLTPVDVELLPTHGGSIRMWARPTAVAWEPSQRVREVLATESAAGLHAPAGHDRFAAAASRVRDDLIAFLIEARRAGKKVVGYGAPGDGNNLLNY